MDEKNILDILIIGSGPAGLSAAVYAKRANRSVLVAEKEYLGAGQIALSDKVDNYLGFAAIGGYELGEAFRAHAAALGVEFYAGAADSYAKTPQGWRVHFEDGKELFARAVIFCAGAAHRHLDIPGEQSYIGRGVSYCAVCDGAFYRQKCAAVIGGGDTALGDALYLSDLCRQVYVVHRRDEFRGAASTLTKLRAKENVEIITGVRPVEITGEQTVTGLVLDNGRTLAVDGVFVAVGMVPQTAALAGIVTLDQTGYVLADETGKTSEPGFFVAGDVRTKRLRQVATAVSDGANAATSADAYLGSM